MVLGYRTQVAYGTDGTDDYPALVLLNLMLGGRRSIAAVQTPPRRRGFVLLHCIAYRVIERATLCGCGH